ncbi:MAG: hypothetical protein IIY77_01345 [Lachnospiraceae bacterium]|nr:hypothetical protein [Lachnospiraceae bacterium]
MPEKMFPRTEVGGVSLSRMIMGTNWMLGWSHTGLAADNMIKRRYADKEPFKAMLEAYLSHGVDTIMAPFSLSPVAPELVKAIRDLGMIPGLSAHMPELITFSDDNGYDVETYIQIYNCMGFLMQVEIETVAGIIHNAKKPVMTIKSMAAGRVTPYVGLNFSWATLRDCDMVTVGAFTPEEVGSLFHDPGCRFKDSSSFICINRVQ